MKNIKIKKNNLLVSSHTMVMDPGSDVLVEYEFFLKGQIRSVYPDSKLYHNYKF